MTFSSAAICLDTFAGVVPSQNGQHTHRLGLRRRHIFEFLGRLLARLWDATAFRTLVRRNICSLVLLVKLAALR
jgi:hypothetical protein